MCLSRFLLPLTAGALFPLFATDYVPNTCRVELSDTTFAI